MEKTDQIIALAKVDGYRWLRRAHPHVRNDLIHPRSVKTYLDEGWVEIDSPNRMEFCDFSGVPNYLGSLNVMREFVYSKIMAKSKVGDKDSLFCQYIKYLQKICGRLSCLQRQPQ